MDGRWRWKDTSPFFILNVRILSLASLMEKRLMEWKKIKKNCCLICPCVYPRETGTTEWEWNRDDEVRLRKRQWSEEEIEKVRNCSAKDEDTETAREDREKRRDCREKMVIDLQFSITIGMISIKHRLLHRRFPSNTAFSIKHRLLRRRAMGMAQAELQSNGSKIQMKGCF